VSTLVFQIVTLLLAAFLIGCAAGCAARRLWAALRASGAGPAGTAALSAPEAGNGPADDLTRIAGIGPATARRLNELGIRRFHQIADWDAADIDRIAGDLRLGARVRREKWVEQAKALSAAGSPPRQ
jgi:predicted flap endonuclease-1-like 5' DNA nuclease